MMKNDKIYKGIQSMMSCLIVALFACGLAERVMAEGVESDKDKPPIVVFPQEWRDSFELFVWSKGNKDGVRIVWLARKESAGFDRVVLVRKDGTTVESFRRMFNVHPLIDDKVEFIWLNDSCFALLVIGKERSSYEICLIDWESVDTRPYESFISGEISGKAQFIFKKGIFRVMKGKDIIMTIPWNKIESRLSCGKKQNG